jgi:hypothetical protein
MNKIQFGIVCLLGVAVGISAGFAVAQTDPIATLHPVSGLVEVKKPNQSAIVAKNGDQHPLYKGDLIRIKPGSEVKLRCTANGIVRTLPDDATPRSVAGLCP